MTGEALVGAASSEAIAAVDRLIAARLERYFRNAAALTAGRLEHFTRTAAPAVRRASGLACRSALGAAARLIGEAFHCENSCSPEVKANGCPQSTQVSVSSVYIKERIS